MSDHKYHFDVKMTCSGCSNAVNRVLNKLEGVKSVDISLEKQSVDVVTSNALEYDTVLKTISKTGKQVLGGNVVE